MIYFAVESPRLALNGFDLKTGSVRTVALVDQPPKAVSSPALVVRGLSVAAGGVSILYVQFDSERPNVLMAEM